MGKDFVAKASVVIDASPDDVWKALTTPAMIKRYLFGTEASSDWKVGSPITYRGVWRGQAYEDKGVILELSRNRLFKSTYWSALSGLPDLPENYNTVAYALESVEGGTKVSVAQDNNPTEEGKTQAESNWLTVLGGLKELLESAP